MTDLDTITTAMARALFAAAWADHELKQGRSHGGHELRDIAPATSEEAFAAAADLARSFEAFNRQTMDQLFETAIAANCAPGARGRFLEETEEARESFGHYLAMQSLGHGVSWFDDNERFHLKIARTEFHL